VNNKRAKQSARDVYSDVFMSAPINSNLYYWSFDRLRNCENGFNRPESHMRFKEFSMVSIKTKGA